MKDGDGNILGRYTTGTDGTVTVTGGTAGGGNDGNDLTVENLPMTALIIEKYLETETGEQPLKGVTFLVTDSSGADIGPNNGEYTSDENGRIVIPSLETGNTVTAREIRVPDGVVLDPTPQEYQN